MPANTFGEFFRVTTFGESRGGGVGAVVDGCPPGLALCESDIQRELDRRKPGQSALTTPRSEADTIRFFSGIFEGVTTGTPIMLMALNKDVKSEDYHHLKEVYRPSHADFTYDRKYGRRDWRGSGRASARETLARVAAGAIAQKFLKEKLGIECLSYVEQVGNIRCQMDPLSVIREQIESNPVRCPDGAAAVEMEKLILEVKNDNDSIGGIVRGMIRNVPAGLGEPVFDKFAAELGKGMLSINAVKGFEFGSGFNGVCLRGSEHNDPFVATPEAEIRTSSNRAGGTLGGITTGELIYFRVAFKPVATIGKPQKTVTKDGKELMLAASGRHDPCVLPRAVPIVDAMSALVTMDHYLRHRARGSF